ncbi:MAG: hypothetical protein GF393_08580 [Armatimonadia bacterium]|nr:hypothetical protein [Armatimonadia bacterium]
MSLLCRLFGKRMDRPTELRLEVGTSSDQLRSPAEHVRARDTEQFGDLARDLLERRAECRFDAQGWSFLFAAAHFMDGNLLLARAELALTLALDPEKPHAYRYLGLILREEGNEEVAQRILEIGWAYHEELLGPSSDEDRERFFHPGPEKRSGRGGDRPHQTERPTANDNG